MTHKAQFWTIENGQVVPTQSGAEDWQRSIITAHQKLHTTLTGAERDANAQIIHQILDKKNGVRRQ